MKCSVFRVLNIVNELLSLFLDTSVFIYVILTSYALYMPISRLITKPSLLPDEYLFDPRLLERIVERKSDTKDSIWVRPLSLGDYEKGFVQVLGQLTKVGDISKEQYIERFRKMKASGDYYVIVAEDQSIGKVIASATLLVEQKFIHDCALRGRLEDVVVNDKYRGKALGQLMVRTVSLLAQRLRCYKLSLDCKDNVINFYEKLGFTKEPANGNSLNARFDYPNPMSNL